MHKYRYGFCFTKPQSSIRLTGIVFISDRGEYYLALQVISYELAIGRFKNGQ